jgi:hypothetical protein
MKQNETTTQHNKRLYKNQLEIRTEAQLHESIVVFVKDIARVHLIFFC